MGDPLSISSGVAGLISLGLALGHGLHKYISAVKDMNNDIETAQQSLALLQLNICALRSSQSKIGRHGLAADGLAIGVINCEEQLKSLQVLLDDFTSTKASSVFKQAYRRQKMRARYPFDRKKLVLVQDQLSRANTTLSHFVNTLMLESVLDISRDLAAVRGLSAARKTGTHTLPQEIPIQLDVVASAQKHSALNTVSQPNRFEKPLLFARNDVDTLRRTGLNNKEIELVSRSTKQVFEQFIQAHSRPRYLLNTELETILCENLPAPPCTCDIPTGQLYQLWRGCVIYKRSCIEEHHRPRRFHFQRNQMESSQVLLRIWWLLFIFSKALIISVTRERPSSCYKISANLRPCYVVESSPAFDIFFHDRREKYSQTNFRVLHSHYTEYGVEHMAESLIRKLGAIYKSGQSTPFDVDENGDTIAHKCVTAFRDYFTSCIKAHEREAIMKVLRKLLSYFNLIGVPIGAFNFEQKHVLNIATDYYDLWMLPGLYELIAEHDRGFYSTGLAHTQTGSHLGLISAGRWIEQLDTFGKYPDMSADLGYSDLFLAAISKDLSKLQKMLKVKAVSSMISEKDLYQRTILHVCADWPGGLKVLLENEITISPLINAKSSFGNSPLDHALCYSKLLCNAPDQWTACHDCACFVPTQLLLEADCSVTIGWNRPKVLRNCSLRARILFFEHMKNRRQRLQQVSMQILPTTFLRRYQIHSQSLPDMTAMVLWNEIEKDEYKHHRLAASYSDSLNPHCGINRSDSGSFFGQIQDPRVAELACTFGFSPKDSPGLPILLSKDLQFLGCHTTGEYITYNDWLLQYTPKLELGLGKFGLSAFHRLATILGKGIVQACQGGETFPSSILRETRVLFSKVCDDEAQSNIPCPCSSGDFNRPIAFLISGMLTYQRTENSKSFWPEIGAIIDQVVLMLDTIEESTHGPGTLYLLRCTVHNLTMAVLGIRHLPFCYVVNSDTGQFDDLRSREFEPGCEKVLDDDLCLVGQLHDLTEEFSEAFQNQTTPIADFLRGYWLRKMEEFIENLH